VGAANAALPAQASRPFIFSDLIEGFSSDGFRRIFFNPKGRPYSPENLWTGGIRLSKPDFAAADGVTTTLNPLINSAESSLSPFFGSSAAAPQIAGIAALLRAIDPAITPGQMRRVLTHSCVDLMQFGVDRESGFGAVRADLAVQNLKLISHKYAHLATTAPPEDQDSRGNR
jgi:subtilisin family serine protease